MAQCPNCKSAVPVKHIFGRRGKAFKCGDCQKCLEVQKASRHFAYMGFAILFFAYKNVEALPGQWIAIIIIFMVLTLLEYLTTDVKTANLPK